jgi:uncharacterized protein YkwD
MVYRLGVRRDPRHIIPMLNLAKVLWFALLCTAVACGPPAPAPAGGSGIELGCADGERSGSETDVDCGGTCAACGDGEGCSGAADCLSGVCDGELCQVPSCSDSAHNGDERGIDCGGPCAAGCAAGTECAAGSDCDSGVCEQGTCAPGRCDDGLRNGDETGLDCGGSCAGGCADGTLCVEAADCLSGVCEGESCSTPACDDGVRNGEEVGVDCGASCAAGCSAGTPCSQPADCASRLCTGDVCEQDPVQACLNGPHAAQDDHRAEACEMLRLINQDRAYFVDEAGGAEPARWDPDMYLVAKAHSQDMCQRRFFEHVNPSAEGPSDRARRMGFEVPVAENIAINQWSASTMHAFMAEPTCTGHRGNILNPRNNRVGIGIIRCSASGWRWDGYRFYTQNFHMDFGVAEAPYCLDPRTACELPDNPVSTASQECPQQAVDWGWCTYDPNAIMDPGWGCPND